MAYLSNRPTKRARRQRYGVLILKPLHCNWDFTSFIEVTSHLCLAFLNFIVSIFIWNSKFSLSSDKENVLFIVATMFKYKITLIWKEKKGHKIRQKLVLEQWKHTLNLKGPLSFIIKQLTSFYNKQVLMIPSK